MLSITRGEAIGNKDFDDFQGEVTRLKQLISDEPNNLQKFESLIYKFIIDECFKTDQTLQKKNLKIAFYRYKLTEDFLKEIANGIIVLQKRLQEDADLLDHESNLFISNIIQNLNTTIVRKVYDKLNLAEQEKSKIRMEVFFKYTKEPKSLGHQFIETL